jgi:hypothetical protein
MSSSSKFGEWDTKLSNICDQVKLFFLFHSPFVCVFWGVCGGLKSCCSYTQKQERERHIETVCVRTPVCLYIHILLPPPAVEWSNNQSSSPSFWSENLLPIGTHLEHNKNQSHKKIRNEYYKKGNKTTTTTKKGMKFMSRLAVKGSKLFGFVLFF